MIGKISFSAAPSQNNTLFCVKGEEKGLGLFCFCGVLWRDLGVYPVDFVEFSQKFCILMFFGHLGLAGICCFA